jgi:hypothetical protein
LKKPNEGWQIAQVVEPCKHKDLSANPSSAPQKRKHQTKANKFWKERLVVGIPKSCVQSWSWDWGIAQRHEALSSSSSIAVNK